MGAPLPGRARPESAAAVRRAGRRRAALTGRSEAAAEPRHVSALVFDFDGLICDTETVVFESVQRVFRDHGVDLTLEDWLPAVGAANAPDWPAALEAAVGRPLDHAMLRAGAGRATATSSWRCWRCFPAWMLCSGAPTPPACPVGWRPTRPA